MGTFRLFLERNNDPGLSVLAPKLAEVAQKVYDYWDQSGKDGDPDLGFGGICQDIADAICGVLSDAGIECTTVDNQGVGDQHVWVVAKTNNGVFNIDIPPSVYETGGGYNWKKTEGVKFNKNDVIISLLDEDPNKFEEYTGE